GLWRDFHCGRTAGLRGDPGAWPRSPGRPPAGMELSKALFCLKLVVHIALIIDHAEAEIAITAAQLLGGDGFQFPPLVRWRVVVSSVQTHDCTAAVDLPK